MLAFIDESGHPHPNDPSSRPVVVAACISEPDLRYVTSRIHGLKRQLLTAPDIELKATRLLTRGTFRRIESKREFVESFFDLLSDLPITTFAIIMKRPVEELPETNLLPSQFRFLLERISLLADTRKEMATILFDGEGTSQSGGLSAKFSNYLYRSIEGRSRVSITNDPFFVDSRITVGIQIADMAASVIRQYEENELSQASPTTDPYLHALRRYYRVLQGMTVDQFSPEGYIRHGLYRMSERQHYLTAEQYDPEEV